MFQIQLITPRKAALVIDLSQYVDSFYQKDKTLYQKLSNDFMIEVKAINGQIWWQELFTHAAQSFSEYEQDIIRQAPAYEIMNDSFVELLKNTMDEFILSQRTTPIQLTLEINLHKQLVQFIIQDTGRGFPIEFVEQMKTKQQQELYIYQTGSKKHTITTDHPHLFGGAGRGLRILLAQANFGKDLVRGGTLSDKYEQHQSKAHSNLELCNQSEPGSGVQITLTTSLEPFDKLRDSMSHHSHISDASDISDDDTTTRDTCSTQHSYTSDSTAFSDHELFDFDFSDYETTLDDIALILPVRIPANHRKRSIDKIYEPISASVSDIDNAVTASEVKPGRESFQRVDSLDSLSSLSEDTSHTTSSSDIPTSGKSEKFAYGLGIFKTTSTQHENHSRNISNTLRISYLS